MAIRLFLHIAGITGDSNDAHHPNEIELESYRWGVRHGAAALGGGGATSKPAFSDLTVTAATSVASPVLFLSCAAGTHHHDATLTATHGSGTGDDFLAVSLTEVLVTSFEQSATADLGPTDTFTLAFSKVKVSYRRQSPLGVLEPPVETGWDVKANASF
jgi:type VI secretion system secreted protein Hcp